MMNKCLIVTKDGLLSIRNLPTNNETPDIRLAMKPEIVFCTKEKIPTKANINYRAYKLIDRIPVYEEVYECYETTTK